MLPLCQLLVVASNTWHSSGRICITLFFLLSSHGCPPSACLCFHMISPSVCLNVYLSQCQARDRSPLLLLHDRSFLGHLLSMSHFWWHMCEGIPISSPTPLRPRALPLSCQSIKTHDLSHQGMVNIFRAKQTLVFAYQLLGLSFLASKIPLFSWQLKYTLLICH